MPNEFSTNAMLGVVEGLKIPVPALLQRYFPRVAVDPSEEIHFDVLGASRRIAPFVSPLVEGQIMESLGHTAKTFKPAYIKDKRRFDPSRPLQRMAGEQIGGNLSPQERLDALLASEMQDQIQMITRRLELMASEALRKGTVTVVGEKYPSTVVDFARHSDLKPAALSSTARWGESAEAPLANLETWANLVMDQEGAAPMDVIMGTAAWTKFRDNAKVEKRIDLRNFQGNQLGTGAQVADGLTRRGEIDGFTIYTYGGRYVDPADGLTKAIWPTGEVALVSNALEGVQFFGAIQDADLGPIAAPYAPKMWTDKDPSVTWLLMQSAPLLVPTRVNAGLSIQVLG